MARYSVDAVKQAAEGRWPEVIARLAGVSESILDGQHHPCPKCGGKDRFNLSREGKGGAFCNSCFTSKNGDGLATICWLTGKAFGPVLEEVAKYLGVKPEGREKKPDQHLEFLGWNKVIVGIWADKKAPIKAEAVQAVGGQVARYRGEYTVIAIPVWGPSLMAADPVGWVIYRQDGGMLPKGPARSPEWVKVKLTAGSEKGIIAETKTCNVLAAKRAALATTGPSAPASAATGAPTTSVTYWKTEGPSDLLAFLSAGFPEGHVPFTTSNGTSEKPTSWIAELLAGERVNVIHDADKPGQMGATYWELTDGRRRPGWCPVLAEKCTEVRNVQLPFPVEPNHGPDLRDYLAGGGTAEGLLEHAAEALPFAPAEESDADNYIDEHEDDPHRLARVNLKKYHDAHGGRLVYWRSEWWKFKGGRYRKIENDELKAKVWAAVRAEFEAGWRERKARGDDKPARKVTRALVNNVIGAMESMVVMPSSVPMPCWLPDRSQPRFLSMKNGILDLAAVFENRDQSECLRPHTPDWFSGFQLDYEFDRDAQCPQWLRYLNYSMEGDQERIDILQEWAGYLLTNSNDLQRFLVLEGEGSNGKTVYFAAMTAMLGEENVSHVSIENFGGRFELGTTIGKAANISGDAGEIDQVAEGVLKQFTGGDIMQFDRKNLQPISARPTAKLMAAWNSRPRIKDRSQGLWRRMLLVPFSRKVERVHRILGMDQPSWWINSGEAPGILLWAIIGLHRLMEQKEFTASAASLGALSEYQKEQNSARRFLSEVVDWLPPDIMAEEKEKPESEQRGVRTDRIYVKYREWCQGEGISPVNNQNFGKEVKRMFGDIKVRRQQSTNRFFVYRLLAWTDPAYEEF